MSTPQQDQFTNWFTVMQAEAESRGETFDIKVSTNPEYEGGTEQFFAELNAFISAVENGETTPITDEDLR